MSLLKISHSLNLLASQKAMFFITARKLIEVSFHHAKQKHKHSLASFDLKHLRDLQNQKTEYFVAFKKMNAKRNRQKDKQTRLNQKVVELAATLEQIYMEYAKINPRVHVIKDKLNA